MRWEQQPVPADTAMRRVSRVGVVPGDLADRLAGLAGFDGGGGGGWEDIEVGVTVRPKGERISAGEVV